LININESKYIHYNLHFSKGERTIAPHLNLYSKQVFEDIEDQIGNKKEDYKRLLFRAIGEIGTRNNLITVIDGDRGKRLTITHIPEDFNTTELRYMCGDFNKILSDVDNPRYFEFPRNMQYDRSDKVDYIVKITNLPASASSRAAGAPASGGEWENKYLKYKEKYLNLKLELGL
jgi:hypothetical protein